MPHVRKPQVTLASFLLLAGALPIWIHLAVEVSPILPLTLACFTMTICLGLIGEKRAHSWAISALLAGALVMIAVAFARFAIGDSEHWFPHH